MPEIDLKYIPMDEKIFNLVKDLSLFTAKDVRAMFPTETDRVIYHSIKKLEAQGRIKFMNYVKREKVYSALGQSALPVLMGTDSRGYPCSDMLKNIAELYTEEGHWKQSVVIDVLPILISKLFLIAQAESGKEKNTAYIQTRQRLLDIRKILTQLVGYVDNITNHPTMAGDMEQFNEVFAGEDPAVPTAQELAEYKKWLNKWLEKRLANKEPTQ